MPVKFNIARVEALFKQSGGKTKFPASLHKVLQFMQNDDNLNSIKEVAYFFSNR